MERSSLAAATTAKSQQSKVKVIKDYQVHLDEFLGKGQFGIVCKARLVAEAKNPNAKVFACKIMRANGIT